MNRGLLMMSEGYALLAQGIKELAMGEDVKPAKASKATVTEKTQETAPVQEKVTIEAVRLVMAEKSRDGKTQEVRKILNEFGVDKLSAVPEEKLPDLLKKVEVL